jgi:hypothetical protein
MINERTRKVVERAAEHIRNGWCKGQGVITPGDPIYRLGGKLARKEAFCLMMALDRDAVSMAAVAQVIKDQYPVVAQRHGDAWHDTLIVSFNDHPHRSKAQVLAVLEKAAAS